MKVKEAEKKAPGGLAIDPKKQIFVSKINMENSPRAGNKDAAEEGVNTEGHLKNLRAKVVAWLRQLILNVGGKSTRKKEADAP